MCTTTTSASRIADHALMDQIPAMMLYSVTIPTAEEDTRDTASPDAVSSLHVLHEHLWHDVIGQLDANHDRCGMQRRFRDEPARGDSGNDCSSITSDLWQPPAARRQALSARPPSDRHR